MKQLVLENKVLRVSFLPEIGGKITSLVEKSTGYEFLLPPAKPYEVITAATRFEDGDRGGFDECLPGIAASAPRDALPAVPDHGELWSAPWDILEHGERVTLAVKAAVSGLRLVRSAWLDGPTLRLEYQLTNVSDAIQTWLWSSHPLLAIDAGDRVLLPAEVQRLRVDYSALHSFRAGEEVAWPVHLAAGRTTAFDIAPVRDGTTAYKLYASLQNEGWCTLHRKRLNRWLRFRFAPQELPHVGIWICGGAWPPVEVPKQYTVALEPCTANCDSLSEAVCSGTARFLKPGKSCLWELAIDLLDAPPN